MTFVPQNSAHYDVLNNVVCRLFILICTGYIVSDIAIFVLKRDVKLQLTNCTGYNVLHCI